MNSSDFNKLLGLLSKLNSTTQHAEHKDMCFGKYNKQSIHHMQESINHVKRLKQGLITAKVVHADQREPNTMYA